MCFAGRLRWDDIGNLEYANSTFGPYGGAMCFTTAINQYGYFNGFVESDADGNPTVRDATCCGAEATLFGWDAENRLVSVTPATGEWDYEHRFPQDGSLRTSNSYDHLHRRVRLSEDIYYQGEWYPFRDHTFVWDGWLLMLERIDNAGGGSQTVEYFWGNDLSGTEQGAGGVGGLLAVSVDGQYYFPCYDHNGNVTAYVGEDGAVAARYAYSPFGETMSATGPMAGVFRFRFSTKYQDEATGLYYYGYRFYDPKLWRFLNRDPVGEQGGLNLYGFVGNDPVDRWDRLGLIAIAPVDDSPRISGSVDSIYASAFVILDNADVAAMVESGGGVLVHGKRVTVTLRDCKTGTTSHKSQALQKRLSISTGGMPTPAGARQPATGGQAYIYFNLLEMSDIGSCVQGTIEVNAAWTLYPKGAALPPLGATADDKLSGSQDGTDYHGNIGAYNGWPRATPTSGWFNFTIRIMCGGDAEITATATPLYPHPIGRPDPANPPDGYQRHRGDPYTEWPWY